MQNIKLCTDDENLTEAAFNKSITDAHKKNDEQPDGLLKRFFKGYINLVSSAHKTSHVDWSRKI